MQMGGERIPKKILDTKMEEKLPRGRPRTRWIYQIRKGCTNEAGKLGRNRRKQKVEE